MGKLLTAVESFFKEDGWDYVQLGESEVLRLEFAGENGDFVCIAHANSDLDQFVFYTVAPEKAPKRKRRDMAELITRINAGLVIGNFELDYTSGEVRYKTSIDVEGDRLTPTLVKRLIYPNVFMMDKYLPGILAIILTDIKPDEAVLLCELTE